MLSILSVLRIYAKKYASVFSTFCMVENSLKIFYPFFYRLIIHVQVWAWCVCTYNQTLRTLQVNTYIVLIIVATLVFILLVLPFTLFLICSHFLARKFNLLRIKPVLLQT